ncbi:hypothetical protein BSKO_10540 [Bryopsis sp. KO-2023]|nr:hypothetical protein BSKO_10540 [Bryopsis sp. KO-2023]
MMLPFIAARPAPAGTPQRALKQIGDGDILEAINNLSTSSGGMRCFNGIGDRTLGALDMISPSGGGFPSIRDLAASTRNACRQQRVGDDCSGVGTTADGIRAPLPGEQQNACAEIESPAWMGYLGLVRLNARGMCVFVVYQL